MEGERPILAEPVSGRKPIEIHNIEESPLDFAQSGGFEDKSTLVGTIQHESGKEREVHLIKRGMFSKEYITYWKAFKIAGLPVVKTIRAVEDGLLVTDVKANGSEIYDKGLLNLMREHKERQPHSLDPIFKEITNPLNFWRVKGRIKHYANVATKHNLQLPEDDPGSLIIRPNKQWDFIFLDLQMARSNITDISKNRLNDINKKLAKLTIKNLKHLRGYFR